MKNDISTIGGINISDIGKYGKFINFTKMPKEYNHTVLFPSDRPFEFTTNELKKEKLESWEVFNAVENMKENLDKAIEAELKKDIKLQSEIENIQLKAKKRVDKLRDKPLKNLRKKYNYDLLNNWSIKPKPKISEGFSSDVSKEESSP